MTPNDLTTDNRSLESLPDEIHSAILTYASDANLTPHAVIAGALKHFLDLDTSLSRELVSAVDDTSLLAVSPPDLQSQARQYADKPEIPDTMTTEGALVLFDSLASVDLEFMMGRWQGAEIRTGHPMDGLLARSNWYGKEFVSPECVHPLLFSDGKGGTFKVSPNAQMMSWILRFPLPESDAIKPLFSLLNALLKTEKSQARLRMIAHRGKVSATMVYDHLPIHDAFRRVDENTVMGLMDYKAFAQPFFFSLKRETLGA